MSARPAEAWRLAPMHETHLAEVLDIEVRAYAFPWTESILRDCLRAGYSAWILQGPDGRILAYALMTMAVGEAHILNVAVDPMRRREGMARHLLGHLLHTARAAHMTIVLLEVRRSNKAALRLYAVDDAQALADQLDSLLLNPTALIEARAEAWRLGQERFNWEVEQVKLLALVEGALAGRSAPQQRPQ